MIFNATMVFLTFLFITLASFTTATKSFKLMEIKQEANSFRISFKFNPRIIEAVRDLPERRFDYKTKSWSVPVQYKTEIEKFAKKFNYDLNNTPEMEIPSIPDLPDLPFEIPTKLPLYPYQRKGTAYAMMHKRVIIGDKMGLGKTAQAIATAMGAEMQGNESFPVLVICPASLKINWQREFAKWSNKRAIILSDTIKSTWPYYLSSKMADVVIINFESLQKYFVESITKNEEGKFTLRNVTFSDRIKLFKSVIIDESHRCKNSKAQMTKFVKGICVGKEYILALSGTPVINKPVDLLSQLGILNRLSDLGGYSHFMTRFCSGDNQATNLKELNYKLATTCFFSRDKKDVLTDLPDKTRQVVYCEIDNRKEYNDAEADLVNYLIKWKNASDEQLERSMRGEVMVRINILKNISARGKLNDVIEFIDDTLESGEKLVLFGHLKEVLEKVSTRYKSSIKITGDVPFQQRQANVDKFQNDESCNLAVCSIKAAGVGLTLTAASQVGFIEMWWTAADHDQCEDRCHRIGQKDNVTATYFLGKNTIDEHIYQIVNNKRGIAKTVTGSEEDVPVDILNEFASLMLKNRNQKNQ